MTDKLYTLCRTVTRQEFVRARVRASSAAAARRVEWRPGMTRSPEKKTKWHILNVQADA